MQVFNSQRKHAVDVAFLRGIVLQVLRSLGLDDQDLSVILISDRAMLQLNRRYRGIRKSTDVLSFADLGVSGYLGDVFISTETAAANAQQRGYALPQELALLILHGILHLAGFDHETDGGRMKRLERRLRRSLALAA